MHPCPVHAHHLVLVDLMTYQYLSGCLKNKKQKVEGSFVSGTVKETIRIHKRVNFNLETSVPHSGKLVDCQSTLQVSVQDFNIGLLLVYLLALVTHMVTVDVLLPNTVKVFCFTNQHTQVPHHTESHSIDPAAALCVIAVLGLRAARRHFLSAGVRQLK